MPASTALPADATVAVRVIAVPALTEETGLPSWVTASVVVVAARAYPPEKHIASAISAGGYPERADLSIRSLAPSLRAEKVQIPA